MTQAMPPAAPPKNDSYALASLICGIASIACCLSILAGIPAIILGQAAKKRIAASGGAVGGETLAKIGVILGIVSCCLFVVGIIINLIWGFAFMSAFSHMQR